MENMREEFKEALVACSPDIEMCRGVVMALGNAQEEVFDNLLKRLPHLVQYENDFLFDYVFGNAKNPLEIL